MRPLPDNPDLDHLRRQAKDLLAGLRDTNPGMRLSAAQAVLARQYGFRTWTELKVEADRRRGGADVADRGLAQEIAVCYGLGEVTGPMRSMARADDMGRRWSLETDQGRWAVRTMDTWIPIVDADSDVALQEAAAAAGVRLPAPVRSQEGAVVESIGGHPWRVYEWLHSGPPLAAPVSSAIAHKVGEILATIHRLRLPVDRISPWHAARLSTTPWTELAATAKAAGAGWATALVDAVSVLADLETIGIDQSPPAPVLTHNALGPANVRHATDGGLIVFDWEHAGGQPPGWELCDALIHWAVRADGEVNAAGIRAMLDGYRSVAGSLPPLSLATFRGAAISLANYVFGLASEALNTLDEEDRRHLDRSVSHVLAQLPSRTTCQRLLSHASDR